MSQSRDVPLGSQQRPMASHKERVRFLEGLAVLVGCREQVGQELPDGKRPDVMRADSLGGWLFFGEAKSTESPGNCFTQARLESYLRWVRIHLMQDGHAAVFALCCDSGRETDRWGSTVVLLAKEVGVAPTHQGRQDFGCGLAVVWALFESRVGVSAVRGNEGPASTDPLRRFDIELGGRRQK